MPFDIKKKGTKVLVINKQTGDVKGRHNSMDKAQRQLKALRINTKDEKK